MTDDSTNATDTGPDPTIAVGRVSRRTLVAGLGLGTAAVVLGRAGNASGAVAGQLNVPGQALEQASRITTTTSTTTTTTTLPEDIPDEDEPPVDDLPPLEPGEIRFPILSGEDDDVYVLNNFGAPRGTRSHEGVDIMADHRLEVIAVVDGVLTREYEDSGSCSGAGNGWTLTDDVNNIVYKYFHLDEHADGLEVGDTVVAGQIIGYVGETGTSGVCSTQFNNFHLHFEYRPNNSARDSFWLLQRPESVIFAS